ncbi:MAG: IclR family transcriptional regulator [Acidobacteriota bacterium]
MAAGKVQSLDRALRILETLASANDGMGISEMSRKLGLSPSTIHRLLFTLSQRGFVTQLHDERYHLGHKIVEMSRTFVEGFQLVKIVRPYLEAVCKTTGETTNLIVLSNNEAFYLDKVESPRFLRVFAKIGRRTPLYCSASGKILLSGFSKEQLQKYLYDTEFTALTEHTITSPVALREKLKTIRDQGYAFDLEECEMGARCAAVPIKDQSDRVIASLSISGPAVRLSDETLYKVVAYLLETSEEISTRIRGHEDALRTSAEGSETVWQSRW